MQGVSTTQEDPYREGDLYCQREDTTVAQLKVSRGLHTASVFRHCHFTIRLQNDVSLFDLSALVTQQHILISFRGEPDQVKRFKYVHPRRWAGPKLCYPFEYMKELMSPNRITICWHRNLPVSEGLRGLNLVFFEFLFRARSSRNDAFKHDDDV